jgi:hypothetical protein
VTVNGRIVYQVFKYSVYALLTINVYVFFSEEVAAVALEHPDGLVLRDVFKAFAATIDTAAWVVLLLMFELETFVLEDKHFTRAVTWLLTMIRVGCYFFIVSAFTGYFEDAIFVQQVSKLDGVSDLCALVGQGWSYAITFGEYVEITAANCASFTNMDAFVRFDGIKGVVDEPGLADIRFLAWVDVVNAAVWLLVVLLLEVDVQLQERNRFEGLALRMSTIAKVVLYSTLALAVVAWYIKGDFADWWDALLWLIAFVFIELNVFEWREETKQQSV